MQTYCRQQVSNCVRACLELSPLACLFSLLARVPSLLYVPPSWPVRLPPSSLSACRLHRRACCMTDLADQECELEHDSTTFLSISLGFSAVFRQQRLLTAMAVAAAVGHPEGRGCGAGKGNVLQAFLSSSRGGRWRCGGSCRGRGSRI